MIKIQFNFCKHLLFNIRGIKMKNLILVLSLLFFSTEVFPQFDILKKVKEKVKEKTEQKVDDAINKTVDDAADQKNNDAAVTDSANVQNEEANTTSTADVNELKSFSKFDFVLGEKV